METTLDDRVTEDVTVTSDALDTGTNFDPEALGAIAYKELKLAEKSIGSARAHYLNACGIAFDMQTAFGSGKKRLARWRAHPFSNHTPMEMTMADTKKRIRTARLTLNTLPITIAQLDALAADMGTSRTKVIERLVELAHRELVDLAG